MITTDLAQVSTVEVVERARLQAVQKELQLGRSKAVDPSTAARLGKLAGATHLVVGTFAVMGKQMRLDGRVVEVGSGKVAIAASAEGEKDAFFELEKTLVGKFIAAINIKVSAKERGEVARIHTTDFEAFRQYAIGVRLSDDSKYEEAIAATLTALKKDEDFRLARVALSEYERLAAELRARADTIATDTVNQHRVELQGEAADKRKISSQTAGCRRRWLLATTQTRWRCGRRCTCMPIAFPRLAPTAPAPRQPSTRSSRRSPGGCRPCRPACPAACRCACACRSCGRQATGRCRSRAP
jgi:TolB-like protein